MMSAREHAREELSRRDVLGLVGRGAVGAAVTGAVGAAGFAGPAAASAAPRVASPAPRLTPGTPRTRFKSRPDLDPPLMQVAVPGAIAPGEYVFVTPSLAPGASPASSDQSGPYATGQPGAMILDSHGNVVWFHPVRGVATDLQVQSYKGKPVLTFWQGAIVNGIGYGEALLLDSTYQTIATIKGGNGLRTDLHELVVTPQDTVIVTAYAERDADLSAVGGPSNGKVFDSVAQEIDVATGDVVFEWRSFDHVPVTESYMKPAKGAFDYFHINSVSIDSDGNFLISSRNTWTIYKVRRATGAIIWRLGGKGNDFEMGPGTHFYWQHHVRRVGGLLTVFDDGATPPEEPHSRALLLALDEAARSARLRRAYVHPAGLLAYYEGSVEILPNGHVFVGWGTEPYYTEFAPDGSVVLDGRFPTNVQSYRAFKSAWAGAPSSPPAFAVDRDAVGGIAVHASWNGATAVTHWQVLAGAGPSSLEPVATLARARFETAMTARTTGSYVAVSALDAKGRRLGTSAPVRI